MSSLGRQFRILLCSSLISRVILTVVVINVVFMTQSYRQSKFYSCRVNSGAASASGVIFIAFYCVKFIKFFFLKC